MMRHAAAAKARVKRVMANININNQRSTVVNNHLSPKHRKEERENQRPAEHVSHIPEPNEETKKMDGGKREEKGNGMTTTRELKEGEVDMTGWFGEQQVGGKVNKNDELISWLVEQETGGDAEESIDIDVIEWAGEQQTDGNAAENIDTDVIKRVGKNKSDGKAMVNNNIDVIGWTGEQQADGNAMVINDMDVIVWTGEQQADGNAMVSNDMDVIGWTGEQQADGNAMVSNDIDVIGWTGEQQADGKAMVNNHVNVIAWTVEQQAEDKAMESDDMDVIVGTGEQQADGKAKEYNDMMVWAGENTEIGQVKNNAQLDLTEEIEVQQCNKDNNYDVIDFDTENSIAPTPPGSSIIDFSCRSSDEYVPNTSSDSSESEDDEDKSNKNNENIPRVTVPESSSESTQSEKENQNTEKRRKQKISLKERRAIRNERLLKRNAGVSYISKGGKNISARVMAPLNKCRKDCKNRILEPTRQKVFQDYWKLGSYDDRALYLGRCITIKKKSTAKVGGKSKRQYANTYSLNIFDKEYPICKMCLLKTLGESSRLLQTVCEKIQRFGRVTRSTRGQTNTNKIPREKVNDIKKHILKFPAYESHYSRSKTSKKYLGCELSIQKMYELYKSEHEKPVSINYYRAVFKTMNLAFKKPSIDTCNKCNMLQNTIKFAKTEIERKTATDQLKIHQEDYEKAYNEKRRDKQRAKNEEEVAVIAFDLQQCLPTPLLSTSSAFYKRQLWVYNLTIHDFETDYAYCYMWAENNGSRGANQIASCLNDFITLRLPLLHPNANHLIMYSDSCGGQNKNSIVAAAMMLTVNNSAQLSIIEHKFLVPGHTHMEVDSDHALIERTKKRTAMNIHHPRDWFQLVRTASQRKNKFSVIEIGWNDFKDYAAFIKLHLMTKKNDNMGRKFVWAQVRVLQYIKAGFPEFNYKEHYDQDWFASMSYAKKNKLYTDISIDAVHCCYNGEQPISAQKKKDLLSMLDYIDPSVHDYYRNLLTSAAVRDNVDPDIYPDEN